MTAAIAGIYEILLAVIATLRLKFAASGLRPFPAAACPLTSCARAPRPAGPHRFASPGQLRRAGDQAVCMLGRVSRSARPGLARPGQRSRQAREASRTAACRPAAPGLRQILEGITGRRPPDGPGPYRAGR